MNELTHLDLCTGIFGFGLAAKWAGFRTVAIAEVDRYSSEEILPKVAPGIPNLGDIRSVDFSYFRGVTVLSAGYPCQPFSLAGERLGEKDDRHLWPAVLEALKASGAAWFVGENVAGHITLGLDQVLSDLDSQGYAARPFVIPACALGASHRRDRVWIVANSDRNGLQGREREWPRFGIEALPQEALWRDLSAPFVCGKSDGIPNRAHRLHALGNAIVPQVAFKIFQAIAEIERN